MARSQRSVIEKAERDKRIVSARLNGVTVAEVAAKEKVSERTVRDVMAHWREHARTELGGADPTDVIVEKLQQYESATALLYELATDKETQDSVRVAAIRAMGDFSDREILLRQAVGLLPRDLGRFAVELDINFIAVQLVATFKRHGIAREVAEEFLALMHRTPEQLGLRAIEGGKKKA